MLLWRELTNELAEAYLYSSRDLWRRRLRRVPARTYNRSSHAVECSFNYKKIPLKFLLSDPGFIGTQIPVAVPCQITRKIRGRKQKGFARSKIRLAAGLPAEQVTQPPPVAFIISRKGWQHGNQCRATHGCRFDSRAALPWFKAAWGLGGELASLVSPRGHGRCAWPVATAWSKTAVWLLNWERDFGE